MKDWRIDQNGARLDFTCANARFRTNINMGESHDDCPSRGSVLREPLVQNDEGYSLWLEYVSEPRNPDAHYYWLMWYDPTGQPTIPMSSIFSHEHIANMQRLLANIP
jgi:hypothetical protein